MIIYEKLFKAHGLSLTQQRIIELVGQNKKVLEVGSSSGYMSKFFLRNNCRVDVVEIEKIALKKVSKKINKVIHKSIEDSSIASELNKDYDFIILSDVIEHLAFPEKALENLKKIASNDTKLILSTPNIACWIIRKELFLKGRFEYEESGILDKTHLRLFTVDSLLKLLSESGWKTHQIIGTITRLPFEGLILKIPIINFIFERIFKKPLVNLNKNLAFVHFIVVSQI